VALIVGEPDLGLSLRDDVDRVGRVALPHDHLAGLEAHDLGGVGDELEPGRGQPGEERDVAQGLDVLL